MEAKEKYSLHVKNFHWKIRLNKKTIDNEILSALELPLYFTVWEKSPGEVFLVPSDQWSFFLRDTARERGLGWYSPIYSRVGSEYVRFLTQGRSLAARFKDWTFTFHTKPLLYKKLLGKDFDVKIFLEDPISMEELAKKCGLA